MYKHTLLSFCVFVFLSFSGVCGQQRYLFNSSEVNLWAARCLDGSPSGYYYRASTDVASQNKWGIYLEGGGYCLEVTGFANTQSCTARSSTALGSSNNWAATKSVTTFPAFSSYNLVYIPYCGGDLHSGTRNETVGGLYYAGHNNVMATIQRLKNGFGLASATDVILYGSSAGGIGVFVNADAVGRALPQANLRVYSDAGWFINITTYNPGFISIDGAAKTIFTNSAGYVNQACAVANPSSPYICYSGNFTYPHLTSPIFISNSLFDTNQLTSQNGVGNPRNLTGPDSYIVQFGNVMRNTLQQVFTNSTTGTYLTTKLVHGVTNGDAIYGGPMAGTTLVATFNNWFSNTPPFQTVDTCYTPACVAMNYTNGTSSSSSSSSSSTSTLSTSTSSSSSTTASSSTSSAATSASPSSSSSSSSSPSSSTSGSPSPATPSPTRPANSSSSSISYLFGLLAVILGALLL